MICPNGQNPGPLQDVSFWQQAQHENVIKLEEVFEKEALLSKAKK